MGTPKFNIQLLEARSVQYVERVSESTVDAAEPFDGVFLKLLAGGETANMQQYRIEPGAAVPEHIHENEQIGYLLQGTKVFVVDGEKRVIEAGDSYAIPAGEPHAAENPGDVPVVGIEVFSPPRAEGDWPK